MVGNETVASRKVRTMASKDLDKLQALWDEFEDADNTLWNRYMETSPKDMTFDTIDGALYASTIVCDAISEALTVSDVIDSIETALEHDLERLNQCDWHMCTYYISSVCTMAEAIKRIYDVIS